MTIPPAESPIPLALRAVREELECAARSDIEVLITGEMGSGKEAMARVIHQESSRQACPFVPLDCADSGSADLETKLFGDRSAEGLFLAADGGTLFLRNADRMSPSTQNRLLKFLGDGEIPSVRFKAAQTRVDVRVITATDSSLYNEVLAGRFSEDLYYRLNVLHIIIPLLGERKDDFRQLLSEFMRNFSQARGIPTSLLSTVVLQSLSDCFGAQADNVKTADLPMKIRTSLAIGRGKLLQRAV